MDPPSSEKSDRPKPETPVSPLESLQLGAWNVLLERRSLATSLTARWHQLIVAIPLFRRTFIDLYCMEPALMRRVIALKVWTGVEGAVTLHLSSKLLKLLETGVKAGELDGYSLLRAAFAKLVCSVIASVAQLASDSLQRDMLGYSSAYFLHIRMRAQVRMDVPTTANPASALNVSGSDGALAFDAIFDFIGILLSTISFLFVITSTSSQYGSTFLTALCVLKPIFTMLSDRSLSDRPRVAHINNPDTIHAYSMYSMSTDHFRSEVLAGGLGEHILNEYSSTMKRLGTISGDWPDIQYARQKSSWMEALKAVVGDLPSIYYIVQAFMHPSTFSMSDLAILRESSANFESYLTCLVPRVLGFSTHCHNVKKIFDMENIQNEIAESDLLYPSAEKGQKGMAFELRNLNFSYPNSKSKTPALSNVNLTFPAGSLVVIVGTNGSGKSSILKLLTRVYAPSDDSSILVDGVPISSYRLVDLRRASAVLSQDHYLFPVSLGDNIGFGSVTHIHDQTLIERAAALGGAVAAIDKLERKYNTRLDPGNIAAGYELPKDHDHPLVQKLKELEKETEISGGERQRVVAARTFMRLLANQEEVKFVAVDEPSSALDPEAEATLFSNLIGMREGKTMVFVTHRFAHLVKHADMIVCMKDGGVAEQGTHEELLALEGEYARLYRCTEN